jgi:hypothetical protein
MSSDKFFPKIPSAAFQEDAGVEYVQSHNTGWVDWVVRKKVVASAAANVTLFTCPAESFVTGFAIQAQAVGANPIDTGTSLGLGISGTLQKFDVVAETAIDNSDTFVDIVLPITPVAQTAAADVLLASTNGSSTAVGSFTGTWHVIVTGKTFVGFGS